MAAYSFVLFVCGHTARSSRAEANLRAIFEEYLSESEFDLQVIDVLSDPERAEADRIFLTPTLIRTSPPPPRRLVGDLSDRIAVLAGLDFERRPEKRTGGS